MRIFPRTTGPSTPGRPSEAKSPQRRDPCHPPFARRLSPPLYDTGPRRQKGKGLSTSLNLRREGCHSEGAKRQRNLAAAVPAVSAAAKRQLPRRDSSPRDFVGGFGMTSRTEVATSKYSPGRERAMRRAGLRGIRHGVRPLGSVSGRPRWYFATRTTRPLRIPMARARTARRGRRGERRRYPASHKEMRRRGRPARAAGARASSENP
jgi:hypothetical protein